MRVAGLARRLERWPRLELCSMLLLLLLAPASDSAEANQSADGLVRQAGQVSTGSPQVSTSPTAPPKQRQQQQASQTSTSTQTVEASAKKPTTSNTKYEQKCEYEKEAWQKCQSNGVQQRILRLKNGSKCEPVKIIRRECKIGCKYARGQWSNFCTDGLRTRVDTLVGFANLEEADGKLMNELNSSTGPSANNKNPATGSLQHPTFGCQPERKVTKDCKRACHYIKSAWSECVNGFKTRNLTLDETLLLDNGKLANLDGPTGKVGASSKLITTGSGCAKQKQVRRDCGRKEVEASAASTRLAPTSANSYPTNKAQTPAQRRRLKQLQRQQKERQQQQEKQQQQSTPASRNEDTLRSNQAQVTNKR